MSLGAPELLVVLVIVLLLFGAGRLPKLARSMRDARDEFEKGKNEDEKTKTEEKATGVDSTPPKP